MKTKLILSLLSILLFTLQTYAQENFRIMFYNVENLYDTINNPKTLDDELTPQGHLRWNSYRYTKKLEDISKVISSLGGKYPPAIVALCEIENKQVLEDLTSRSSLTRHRYKYEVTNSKDTRGSNIALLYQRDQFKILSKNTYTPIIDKQEGRTTRDILHITGMVVSGDTLDFFVCHFPSRNEGIKKSEPYRIKTSELLKSKIDQLYKRRRKANIIVMGDFNDTPNDKSIKGILKATKPTDNPEVNTLYNLSSTSLQEEIRSYKYRGKWHAFDQLITNGRLLKKTNTTYIINQVAQVFNPPFLLEEDEKYGGTKPFRTYSGWSYLGGTSDHLPIYTDLYIKE